jgi:transposase
VTTIAVLSGPERRRRWTSAEKQRIVEESLASAASVVEVARRHDVHPNLLTVWRRQARAGAFVCGPELAAGRNDEVQFAAVAIAPEEQQALPGPSGSCGSIEIELASGARLRITGTVDPTVLQATLVALTKGSRRPSGVRVWLATGYTDMRKGFPSLALDCV